MKVVAFTGHRPTKIGGYNDENPRRVAIKEAMRHQLRTIIASTDEEVVVISGGALGVDTDAAYICIEEGIRFIVAAPCRKQWKPWIKARNGKATFDRYQHMCEMADPDLAIELNTTGLFRKSGVLYIHNNEYDSICMQDRNEWMVDHCDILIAVYDGSERGGTANCVTYAKSVSADVVFINPNRLVKEDQS